MNHENAVALYKAHIKGYNIKIYSGGYLDGFAQLYKKEDNKIYYSSSVYTDRPLSDVRLLDVTVMKEVAVEDFCDWNLEYRQEDEMETEKECLINRITSQFRCYNLEVALSDDESLIEFLQNQDVKELFQLLNG